MAIDAGSAAGRDALTDAKRALLARRLRGGAAAGPAVAIPRRTGEGPAPLSYAQQRLWFLDQLTPGSAFYNVPSALPLRFPVDPDLLARSIREIVRRHESLRTIFVVVDGEPVQRIAPDLEIPLEQVGLEQLPADQRRAEAERLAAEEARRPFDLGQGPLLRTVLVRSGPSDYLLLLTFHHIVCDGWSMGVFFRELRELYEASATGRPHRLRDLPIQYADFAVWQRRSLAGGAVASQAEYWTNRLADLPTLELPTDHPRPRVATFRGAFHTLQLPRDVSIGVEALTRRTGCTPFMVLVTAFKLLLCRYAGQHDIVVGAPIANRTRAETEALIGFFVNTLVLRTDLSNDPTFLEALERVRETTIGAYANQDLPFEKLVETLQPDRELSRNPLCQVTFQVQNAPTGSPELPTLADVGMVVQRGTAIFDLAFSLWQTQDGYIGGMEYSTDLFEAGSIAQLAQHFEQLCRAVTTAPDVRVSGIPLLSPGEEHAVLNAWNQTDRSTSRDVLLHHLFEETADRKPLAPALLLDDRHLTFGALEHRANRLSHWLRERDVGRDRVVGVCMDRSFEMIVALLGILKAGGAYLPLDPQLPRQRMAYIAAEAHADVVLTTRDLVAVLADAGLTATALDSPGLFDDLPDGRVESDARPESLAYVLYTSGSTGVPKGVMVPHSAICNHMLWMSGEGLVTEEDRVLQRTPFTFDASVWELFAPLQTGAAMIIAPPGDRADTGLLVDTVERHRVTVLQLVPSLLGMMLDEPGFSACRSLRRVFCGGEVLTTALAERLCATLPVDLFNLYGPTEATIDASYWKYTPGLDLPTVPIGRPIANTRIYVLDQQLRPVPYGVRGELWIGGLGLARGYVNSPALTAERFKDDPFASAPGSRMYKTGDVGLLRPTGTLEYVGRRDDQVKLRGYRVELGEIERILEEDPAVNQAVAVVREDRHGDARLVAYVTSNPAPEPETESERATAHIDRLVEWQSVFDDVYGRDGGEDHTFDTSGWTSTYTGQPLPGVEMQEWRDQTIARIAALPAADVLEIGCGTGLLLFPVAPRCHRYTAHDFSPAVLRTLRRRLASSGLEASNVVVEQRAAHELDDIAPESFDLVILNSVVQYFPSVDYLVNVMTRAVALVRPGGFVFLGDVYALPLMPAFALSVELASAADGIDGEELRERMRRRIATGKELALDPMFFTALRHLLPTIQGVWLQPKRGAFRNEMTAFRYDVTLRIGAEAPSLNVDLWLDGSKGSTGPGSVEATLASGRPPVCAIGRVPNARVHGLAKAVEALSSSARGVKAADLRQLITEANRFAGPEDWTGIEHRQPYHVDLRWDRSTDDGALTVFACRRDLEIPRWVPGAAAGTKRATVTPATLRRLGTTLPATVAQGLPPALRQSLSERVPSWMVPSTIVVLDQLPLKRNGKVDRSALPAPDWSPAPSHANQPPRNALDEVLSGIMADVLGTASVGIEDNFFTDLGGHSLLATQFASRVRDVLSTELPLRTVFEAPTVAGLADALTRDAAVGARLERMAQLLMQIEGAQGRDVQPPGR